MPIVLSHLSFCYPCETKNIISDISASFSTRLTGLIGDNGAGKSTLLRLITGELTPSSGTIKTSGSVGYLPQDIVRHDNRTIANLLGIDQILDALHAIEAGSVDEAHFDTVGANWDIADRAQAILARHCPSLGRSCDLNRTAATLSGGEILRVALAGLWLRNYQTVVLDEPTNNLDRASKFDVYHLLQENKGQILVVSHDLGLLERVDEIAEVRQGKIRQFAGSYSVYKEAIAIEQAAAAQDVSDAKRKNRLAQKAFVEAQTRMARATKNGKKAEEKKKFPPKLAGLKESRQQVKQGKLKTTLSEAKNKAQDQLKDARAKLRDDDTIAISLPDPKLSASKNVLQIVHTEGTIYLRGPERIALIGNNGTGKSTLLATIMGEKRHLGAWGIPQVERVGYLTQKIDNLSNKSVFDVVKEASGSSNDIELRNKLAQFLIRGDRVFAQVDTLSGGERFRVALACLLLKDPAYQLLLLDEPTNNIDLSTRENLIKALRQYKGAFIVVSHDQDFCEQINLTATYCLHEGGALERVS